MDTHYTYDECAQRVSAITDVLRKNNINQQNNIAVLVDRTEWCYISALGILNNGCTYVPIDDNYPDARIVFMLKDVNAACLLCNDKTYKRCTKLIKKYQIKIINLSNLNISERKLIKNTNIDLDSVACILYTSGTTGNPKGSLITHRAIVNIAQ